MKRGRKKASSSEAKGYSLARSWPQCTIPAPCAQCAVRTVRRAHCDLEKRSRTTGKEKIIPGLFALRLMHLYRSSHCWVWPEPVLQGHGLSVHPVFATKSACHCLDQQSLRTGTVSSWLRVRSHNFPHRADPRENGLVLPEMHMPLPPWRHAKHAAEASACRHPRSSGSSSPGDHQAWMLGLGGPVGIVEFLAKL